MTIFIQRFHAVAIQGTFTNTPSGDEFLTVPAFFCFNIVFNPRDLYYWFYNNNNLTTTTTITVTITITHFRFAISVHFCFITI